ncbi:MAG: hypothetical protein GXP35_17740 [Actinobacteria bacterium]|nr:hypothetical protein [Actinomycetota bacterium]
MIKNERQYKVTWAKADEARVAVRELDNTPLPDGLSPEMRELRLDALKGTLGDFETELDNYDARYEAGDYAGASFARLVEIAEALDLTIHYDVRLASAG